MTSTRINGSRFTFNASGTFETGDGSYSIDLTTHHHDCIFNELVRRRNEQQWKAEKTPTYQLIRASAEACNRLPVLASDEIQKLRTAGGAIPHSLGNFVPIQVEFERTKDSAGLPQWHAKISCEGIKALRTALDLTPFPTQAYLAATGTPSLQMFVNKQTDQEIAIKKIRNLSVAFMDAATINEARKKGWSKLVKEINAICFKTLPKAVEFRPQCHGGMIFDLPDDQILTFLANCADKALTSDLLYEAARHGREKVVLFMWQRGTVPYRTTSELVADEDLKELLNSAFIANQQRLESAAEAAQDPEVILRHIASEETALEELLKIPLSKFEARHHTMALKREWINVAGYLKRQGICEEEEFTPGGVFYFTPPSRPYSAGAQDPASWREDEYTHFPPLSKSTGSLHRPLSHSLNT